MLKRYIGSIDEVTVTVNGTDYGVVMQGQALSFPDDVANAASWPEENWEDVADTGTNNSNKDDE
jgi:hypothetical protein